MFKIIAILSLYIRIYIFPNPFENYIVKLCQNTFYDTSSVGIANIFNLVFGGFLLWIFCYPLVRLVYKKGDNPILGSLLYMGSVFINSKILIMISFYDIKTAFILFVGIYILEIFLILFLKNIYYKFYSYC